VSVSFILPAHERDYALLNYELCCGLSGDAEVFQDLQDVGIGPVVADTGKQEYVGVFHGLGAEEVVLLEGDPSSRSRARQLFLPIFFPLMNH